MLTWLAIQGQLGKQDCDKEGHRNCFTKQKEIEVELDGSKHILDMDNWFIVVNHKRKVHPLAGIKVCLDEHGICPYGIISPMSFELWNLHQACGGTSRIAKPSEFYELPSLYVDAVQVINEEMHRIEEIRKDNDQ